jgi:hypothetical protein
MTRWWQQPLAGDIVWSHFPDELQIKAAEKPRPALILTVYDDNAPHFGVLVAYGTSQRVAKLYRGEFAITRVDGAAYKAAGLSYDTKFNLVRRLQLPFSDEYFAVPPGAPNGQTPKLGVLHPVLVKRAAAAWKVAGASRGP